MAENFANNLIIAFQIRTQFLPASAVDSFIKCAKQIENASKSDKSFKWFVSSDDEEVIEMLKIKYHDKLLHGIGKIGHIANSTESYGRTLVDITLLSKADFLITTSGSTFGFIASMMTGRLNYFSNGHDECKKMTMSNPGSRLVTEGPDPKVVVSVF